LLARKPRQLSGGQRQRVAMGRAIVRQPRAFLMDEPLSNLDAKLRVQMRAEIARLQRSLGVTTIYVTHDQTEAMTLGNRVAVLQHGVLQQVAPPQELYKRPANLFVASFIGSPAMNLLEATVERGDGGPQVCFGTHRLTAGERAVREHPALEDYLGRKVILGIRPENLEDAALVPDAAPGSVLDVQVELREELGSEVDVHCNLGGEAGSRLGAGVEPLHAVTAEKPDDPAAEEEIEPLSAAIVARMDPRTTLTESQTAKVHVDLSALHFFDPETGESLREPAAA
jgi:multiple sugar transport system ATP-binding protein